jgi:tetratricopeptide (TPR) repeat protein
VQELNTKLLATNRSMRKQMNREVHSERSVVRQENESQQKVVELLRQGKGLLKEKRAAEAKACFERALVSISAAGNQLNSPWKAERKARRGLGAAAKQLGEYEEAERNLLRVCELCETMLPPGVERPELADAYGVLADMYTEWGKLDQAGEFYDKMIDEMAAV